MSWATVPRGTLVRYHGPFTQHHGFATVTEVKIDSGEYRYDMTTDAGAQLGMVPRSAFTVPESFWDIISTELPLNMRHDIINAARAGAEEDIRSAAEHAASAAEAIANNEEF